MKTARFRKWCALLIPALIVVFFFVGFLFAPNNPMESNLLLRYAEPSVEYPFGTDALGRCILSRILYGGWTTLGIVLGGSLIVFLAGTVVGMATSRAVMKENALVDGLINAVTAIPPIAYLIVFIGAWGSGAKTTLVALTVSITGFSFIGLGFGDNVVDWGSMILDAMSRVVVETKMIMRRSML